mgnify:CR=1 FL=1
MHSQWLSFYFFFMGTGSIIINHLELVHHLCTVKMRHEMNALLLFLSLKTGVMDGYIIWTIISVLILGYLLNALFKPEKF